MGLMDRMMDRMIANLSVAEKEDLMLNMMPYMLRGVDVNQLMPELMTRMGRVITITGVFRFTRQASSDAELREASGVLVRAFRERIPELADLMQDMAPTMVSLMTDTGLMDRMMRTMGELMPVMMPALREMMPVMMQDHLPRLLAEHEALRQALPAMMIDVMPECVDTLLPAVDEEQRRVFLAQLTEKMGRAAGGADISAELSQPAVVSDSTN